jgi:hypothetical protein
MRLRGFDPRCFLNCQGNELARSSRNAGLSAHGHALVDSAAERVAGAEKSRLSRANLNNSSGQARGLAGAV